MSNETKKKYKKKVKACIYARKSTSKLGQSETIQNQIKICQSHAERVGLDIVDIKRDVGSGTDDLNRPEIKSLIDDALAGKYQCVIMKGISRFYRNTAKGLELIDLLDRNNIRVITIEEAYDSEKSRYGTGRLDNSKISMFLTFSEMESRKLGDRIKYTQLEKAKEGEWNAASTPPFGYKYNPDTKKLDIVQSEAEVVRLIYKLYNEEGMGIGRIREYLEENAYLNRNTYKWSYSKVRYIISNETYTGTVVYNRRSKKEIPYKFPDRIGKKEYDFRSEMVENDEEDWIVTPNAHEAIISKELFDRTQSVLKSRANNRGIKQSYSLLAGIAKCGKCGGGMYLKNPGVRNGKQRPKSYYCVLFAKRGKKFCSNHHIRQDELEGYVFGALKKIYEDESIIDKIANRNEHLILGRSDLDKSINRLEKELDSIISKTDNLLEKNTEGKISDTQFERMNEKYSLEYDATLKKLNTLKGQLDTNLSDKAKIDRFKNNLKQLKDYDNMSHERKRGILLELVDRIVVTPLNDSELEVNIKYKFEA